MKALIILAFLAVCLESKGITRPTDPLLVFHQKGTVYSEVRFGYMKVQIFDFKEFYEAADPESWHTSSFKEIEGSFKIKKVDVRDTDHVVRLKLRQRGGYGKTMWVEGAFLFSMELKSLAQAEKTRFLEVDKYFTYKEGLKILKNKMPNNYEPLFQDVQDLDCYTQSLKNGKLEVAIQVPFIRKDQSGLELITRINVPIIYKDEIFGEIDPEYKILQHPDSKEHSIMTNEEFAKCKYTLPVNLLCREKLEPHHSSQIEETCESALFFKRFKKAGTLCLHKLIQPHHFSVEIKQNKHLVYTPQPVMAKLICQGKFIQNVLLEKLQIVDLPEDDDCMIIDDKGDIEIASHDPKLNFLKGKYILHVLTVHDLETMWPELTSKVLRKMVKEGDDSAIKIDNNDTLSFVLDQKDEL